MAPVFWTERARSDLLEIGDYIAQRSQLMERTSVLAEQPKSGRIVPEIGAEEVRELIHGNYRIVYRLCGEEAHILTVFEGHRLFDADKLDSNAYGEEAP